MTLRAVSYTHLDVYKRQSQNMEVMYGSPYRYFYGQLLLESSVPIRCDSQMTPLFCLFPGSLHPVPSCMVEFLLHFVLPFPQLSTIGHMYDRCPLHFRFCQSVFSLNYRPISLQVAIVDQTQRLHTLLSMCLCAITFVLARKPVCVICGI